ncbi:DNA-(apurinic or apyrimidinic site) endonuclease [Citrus sinensis]|nr:DNA-(apurinic or apyrimidinic site) endonuclease [Citrus sinensis]
MKRFFKPIEKECSAKKPALSPSKKDGETTETSSEENSKKDPLKFVTWNANSLLLRVKNNWPEFSNFITTFDPDVIALQEVRMPAAGSKDAPKNHQELKDDTKASREEKLILMRALSSPPFKNYQIWWSLADSKGSSDLVKYLAFPCISECSVCHFLLSALKYEPDGRVILAEFETFYLLNTYAPNNGWKEEENSFQRRRKWDKRIQEFVSQCSGKPLIWCGDLNVSHEEIDVSHPEFFAAAKLNGYVPPNKEVGRLIDAYRFLHKEKDMDCGFSWSGNPIGKYRGKRMRIDYFIVSEELKDHIIACEMQGHGIELEGFYGSDHCPVSLELSEASSDSEKREKKNLDE